jgi:NADP-dependent 3-hydroxy acid dehydrogenase YdfG
MNVQDKVIIITGATTGIGKATAELLHAKGAKVVLAARNQELLTQLEAKLKGSRAIVCDMTKEEDIVNLIQTTKSEFKRIDVLVNNAGQGLGGNITEVDPQEYRDTLELNVVGPMIAMQKVIPIMTEQKSGVILNVSSMVTKGYYLGLGAYSSTKYALNSISLTARRELEATGIKVCVFMPKLTDTPFGTNSKGDKFDIPAAKNNGANVDTPEAVAIKIVEQIESEDAEATM